eukprot:Skav207407  [mRNA]  locus=scaffold646:88056:88445:+ [translate_table: standard]
METCPVCTVTLIVVGVVLVLALVTAVLAFGAFRSDVVVVPAQVAAVEMPKHVQVCGQAYLAQQVHLPIQAVQAHALHQVRIQPAPPAPLPAPPPPPPCWDSPVYIQPPDGSRQVCIQAPPGQQPVFVLR